MPDEKSYYFILVFFFLSKAKLSSKLFLLQASFNKKWCLGCQLFFSHKLESRSSVQLKRQENNGYPSRYWYFGIFLAREYLEKSGISVYSDGVPFAYSFYTSFRWEVALCVAQLHPVPFLCSNFGSITQFSTNSAWSRQVAGRVGVCMICSGRASSLGLRIKCPSSSVRCLVEVLGQVLR